MPADADLKGKAYGCRLAVTNKCCETVKTNCATSIIRRHAVHKILSIPRLVYIYVHFSNDYFSEN